MIFGFFVHLKLLYLINVLLLKNILYIAGNYLAKCLRFISINWYIEKFRSIAYKINTIKERRKQAIVILTTISTMDYPSPPITEKIGKQNAFYLERIMTEKLAYTLITLRKNLLKNNKDISLFVCYQDRYFYKYRITDWLEHLPDYSRCLEPLKDISDQIDKRFLTVKENFDSKLDNLDLSFDADSYLSSKPKYCALKVNAPFKYICAEDTEDSQALEVATRIGFCHDNQDVVVLNPHAVELTDKHIADALSYLEKFKGLKNRITYGRTKRGGLYLFGVSRSRECLLNLRRLTRNVFMNASSGYNTLEEQLEHLKWTGSCLRSVLDDVNSIDSLPLLERHVGIRMEDIPNDLISVVIPTCNHEEFIEETLESLVYHISGKRYIQVIVIDANSTDYTLNRVDNFQKNIEKNADCCLMNRKLLLSKVRQRKTYTNGNSSRSRSTSIIDPNKFPRIDYEATVSIDVKVLPKEYCQNREEQVGYAVKHFVEGGTILILRPGTNLPLYWDISVRRCLNNLGVILGTFSFNLYLQDRYIARKNFGWAVRSYITSILFNFRSKCLEMPSGDQAFFMYTYYYRLLTLPNTNNKIRNASIHEHLHLTPNGRCLPPVLDDVDLLDRVRSAGHVNTCEDIVTICPIKSMRFGFCRCWMLDALIITAYRLGANVEDLNQYCNELVVVQPDYYDGY